MNSNIVKKSKERYLGYEKRHQELLDVAIRLFNEKGYRSVTTSEIANEAGISEPTIYKHFQNKKDLFLECWRSIINDLLTTYKDVYTKTTDDEKSYLEGVTRAYVDFVINNPNKSKVLIHLLSYVEDKEFNNEFKNFMKISIDGIRNILSDAKKKGKLKSKIDVHLLASIFISQYFTLVAVKEVVDPKYFNADAFVQLVQDMLNIK